MLDSDGFTGITVVGLIGATAFNFQFADQLDQSPAVWQSSGMGITTFRGNSLGSV